MNSNDNYIINKRPRHLRYLFVVDSTIRMELLYELFFRNMELWGGRYNPIIPTYNNQIPDSYKDFILQFDPDYVFYSSGIDIDFLREELNPISFKLINQFHIHDLKGVDSTYLLDDPHQPLLCETGYLYKSKIKDVLNFYSLNFGFHVPHYHEHPILHNTDKLLINDDNLDSINKLIVHSFITHKNFLSEYEYVGPILQSTESKKMEMELIISDDTESEFDDLIYYWNRQMYFTPGKLGAKQVYIKKSDLEILSKRPDFDYLITHLCAIKNIAVVSYSLSKEVLEGIAVNELAGVGRKVPISVKELSNFPFEIDKEEKNSQKSIPVQSYFAGGEGLLEFPVPSFAQDLDQSSGVWAIDLEIKMPKGKQSKSDLKFPKGFNHLQVSSLSGRINMNNDLTLINGETDINGESVSFSEIQIPSLKEIIQARLSYNFKDGKMNQIVLKGLCLSDAGNRLSALLNLFDWNWNELEQYFKDKFWVDIFKSDSQFTKKESNIPSSKGVVSLLDLKKERGLIYAKNNVEDTTVFRDNDEEYIISDKLQNLINKKGAFIGQKVKCHSCGSNQWYSNDELGTNMLCKGCVNEISPSIETKNYYRISEVIRGNMLSESSVNKKDSHGNYIVLRTLFDLRNDNAACRYSFICSPPLEYTPTDKHVKKSDIDIVVIQDGKLIIGEAKNRARDFTNKELRNLAWLGNNIEPDKLILAYAEGEVSLDKIDELKEMLNFKCDIVNHKVKLPVYYFHGVGGLASD